MIYSVNLLTTAAECDSLLTIAEKEKGDLSYRHISLERQKENFSETITEVDQDQVAINAEVAAQQTIVAALPDGPAKEDAIEKLKRAEFKQFLLGRKDKNYGSISLLSLELELGRSEKEIDEVETFIADINAKKASL